MFEGIKSNRTRSVAAALCLGGALAFPAAASADHIGGGPGEPFLSGFGNGGQSNGATVCHVHSPGVTVFNKNGSHGSGECGE